MRHALSLALVLLAIWLLLSGIYTGLLIALGVVSCAAAVIIALRMDVVDREGHPVHLKLLSALHYLAWLAWEVVKSNVDVARRILSPSLPIDPAVVQLRTSQRTQLGRVIYANSITLTPGTVSINLRGDEIRVHALTRSAAESLRDGEMDARVTKLEAEGGGV